MKQVFCAEGFVRLVGGILLVLSGVSPAAADHWGNIHDDGCVSPGTRRLSAQIHTGGSWERACAETPIVIHGHRHRANRCDHRGPGGMWGNFEIRDVSCDPRWGDLHDDGCVLPGVRRLSAQIHTVGSWEEGCESTPISIGGREVTASRCDHRGVGGMWGNFEIHDASCEPEEAWIQDRQQPFMVRAGQVYVLAADVQIPAGTADWHITSDVSFEWRTRGVFLGVPLHEMGWRGSQPNEGKHEAFGSTSFLYNTLYLVVRPSQEGFLSWRFNGSTKIVMVPISIDDSDPVPALAEASPEETPPTRLLFQSRVDQRAWEAGPEPILAEVARGFLDKAAARGIESVLVTSYIRTPEQDRAVGGTGVHVHSRAIDISLRGFSRSQAESIRRELNAEWQYDPSRPGHKVVPELNHGTGPHFHIQVHPNTRRR